MWQQDLSSLSPSLRRSACSMFTSPQLCILSMLLMSSSVVCALQRSLLITIDVVKIYILVFDVLTFFALLSVLLVTEISCAVRGTRSAACLASVASCALAVLWLCYSACCGCADVVWPFWAACLFLFGAVAVLYLASSVLCCCCLCRAGKRDNEFVFELPHQRCRFKPEKKEG